MTIKDQVLDVVRKHQIQPRYGFIFWTGSSLFFNNRFVLQPNAGISSFQNHLKFGSIYVPEIRAIEYYQKYIQNH